MELDFLSGDISRLHRKLFPAAIMSLLTMRALPGNERKITC